jgi:hypothetical protein
MNNVNPSRITSVASLLFMAWLMPSVQAQYRDADAPRPTQQPVLKASALKSNSANQQRRDLNKVPGVSQQSDEIRCRGYAKVRGAAYVFFTINSRPSSTGETIVTYEIAYTPGLKAAGMKGEGLRPGECSWVDRPMSQTELYRIRFETSANAQLKQQLHGTPLDTSPTAAERFPDVTTIPQYLKVESHFWRFFGVYNTGKGYYQATGNTYWKPILNVEDEIHRPPDDTGSKVRRRVVIPGKP